MEQVIDYLSKNPNVLLMGLGVVVGIVILILTVVSGLLGKAINISAGPFKFATTEKQKDCPYGEVCKKIKTAVDFYNYEDRSKSLVETIVAETVKLSEEKDLLLFKESLTHIMMIVEEYNVKIRSIFTEQYYNELKKHLQPDEDAKSNREYKYFQVLINTVLDDLKRSSLKQSIESVNISEMDDSDFRLFCEQKTSMMFLIITEYLDLMYNPKSSVSRDDMQKSMVAISDKVIILYKEMYKDIRTVKIEDDIALNTMEQNIKTNAENLRQKMLGDDPLVKIKSTLEIIK